VSTFRWLRDGSPIAGAPTACTPRRRRCGRDDHVRSDAHGGYRNAQGRHGGCQHSRGPVQAPVSCCRRQAEPSSRELVSLRVINLRGAVVLRPAFRDEPVSAASALRRCPRLVRGTVYSRWRATARRATHAYALRQRQRIVPVSPLPHHRARRGLRVCAGLQHGSSGHPESESDVEDGAREPHRLPARVPGAASARQKDELLLPWSVVLPHSHAWRAPRDRITARRAAGRYLCGKALCALAVRSGSRRRRPTGGFPPCVRP